MMASIKSCKDCSDRQVGCHGTCEKYLSEKAEMEERRRAYRQEKAKPIWDYVSEQRLKKGKKHH